MNTKQTDKIEAREFIFVVGILLMALIVSFILEIGKDKSVFTEMSERNAKERLQVQLVSDKWMKIGQYGTNPGCYSKMYDGNPSVSAYSALVWCPPGIEDSNSKVYHGEFPPTLKELNHEN